MPGLVGVALRCSAYQITTWPSPWRTIGLPGSHLNAAAKAGRFEGAPTARNCAGACSSVAMRFFSSSGVKLRRHTVAQLRKKRWSRLSPAVRGSGVSPAAAVEGLSGDQRFFLNWATVWRRNFTAEELKVRLVTDSHAPANFRAIGAPSNMTTFADAFSCKPGQPMVRGADKQIHIW